MFIRSFPATVFTSSAVLSDSGKPYGGIAGISEFSSLQARPRHPGQQSVRSEAILTNELVKHKPKFQLCLCLHHHPHPHDPDPTFMLKRVSGRHLVSSVQIDPIGGSRWPFIPSPKSARNRSHFLPACKNHSSISSKNDALPEHRPAPLTIRKCLPRIY